MNPKDDPAESTKPDAEEQPTNNNGVKPELENITSPITPPERFEEQDNVSREELGQSNSDKEHLPNPGAVDEESLTTSPSETPTTFRSRSRRLMRLDDTDSEGPPKFTSTVGKDQLIRSLDNYIVGYPKVAGFMNSDPNFLIYRKFGWLHNRTLLYLQDELRAMELQLTKWDAKTSRDGPGNALRCRQVDWASSSEKPQSRRVLVKKITEKLREYDELLVDYQKIQAFQEPSIRNQVSLFTFIRNTWSMGEMDSGFTTERIDLAALAPEADVGWYMAWMVRISRKIPRRATRVSPYALGRSLQRIKTLVAG
ncbi:MAG: hypothetical protein Q9213_003533 [Squamulea squamosa]